MTPKNNLSKSSINPTDKDKQSNSSAMPGWPGYRTREGRSGYDPIDTRTEAAHTAGTILQKLLTGQMRNPIHLALLGILGLILITPLVLAISEIKYGNVLPWNAWIFLLIIGVIGLAILINFIKNLIKIIIR